MREPGFYVGRYRCWIDKDQIWLEDTALQATLPIDLGYVGQVIEMLARQSNARKYTSEAQVRSTDDE